MARGALWTTTERLGAVASLVGLASLVPGLPLGVRAILVFLLVAGVLIFLAETVRASRSPFTKVGRDAMIATGNRLLGSIKDSAIMFSGDMSWSRDYEDVISRVSKNGKHVVVMYPETKVGRVHANAQTLQEAGATLIATATDSGLRGMLLDHDDHAAAVLYIANRELRRDAKRVAVGEPGNENNYEYVARIYTMERDWPIIGAVSKIYEIQRSLSK
jgi:hypothetical protein